MLDREFTYYLDNQNEIVKTYNGKVVVIKDDNVVDVYDSKEQAYFECVKKYKLGTFLIMRCSPGNEAYNVDFRHKPNIIFA